MRTPRILTVAAVGAALLLAARPASAQPLTLRYKAEVGQRRVYQRVVRTDTTVRAGDQGRRTVTEVPLRREELIIETKGDPPATRLVALDAPVGEKLVGYEENGQDRLPAVPEANRLRPLPPILSTLWRDPRGQPTEKVEKPTDPSRALDLVQAEMRYLPEKAMAPGDTWSRELDLGIGKAVILTKFVAARAEGTTPCAVLETTATVTFAGPFAEKIKVEKMTSQMAWATDGSGWVSHTASLAIVEKTDKAEQRVVREFQEKLAEAGRLEATQLDKAKKDLVTIERAVEQAKAEDLDAAMETLDTYLKDNPQGAWTAAVQSLHAGLSQRRLLTKPVPATRLRLMLRDLQTARDQAGAQSGAAAVMQIDQTIRQVAKVNLKTLLEDAGDPDPIVRDLAAFGLAFAEGDAGAARLTTMIKDASPQVRGTAIIGLAIQGKPVEPMVLVDLLKDDDARTRGGAALLAGRTVKKDDPQAAALFPLLLENLKSQNLWTRLNTMAAVVNFAPSGSATAVRAILDATKAEKEPRVQAAYLGALKKLTGIDAKDFGPYEDWLRTHPAAPAPAPPPATPRPAPTPPAPPATPPGATPAPSGATTPKG